MAAFNASPSRVFGRPGVIDLSLPTKQVSWAGEHLAGSPPGDLQDVGRLVLSVHSFSGGGSPPSHLETAGMWLGPGFAAASTLDYNPACVGRLRQLFPQVLRC